MQASILHIPHQETPYPEPLYRCIPLMGIAIEIKQMSKYMIFIKTFKCFPEEETYRTHIKVKGSHFMFRKRREGFVIALN